ncbi:MAG: M20 family metallopeptidase, partial [Bacillota bacterium]
MATYEEIIQTVRPKEIVEFCRNLLRVPSVNPPGDVSRCARLLRDLLLGESIEVAEIPCGAGRVNVVARLGKRGCGERLVLLNGHLDTVPVGPGWTRDPFGAELAGGRIFGRGSSDMKAGLAAMAFAVISLKRSAVPLNGSVVFTAVADEETGSWNGTRYLMEHYLDAKPDMAVVGEPTSLLLYHGNRGVVWADITVTGQACHAGRPHLGANAITQAARLISRLACMQFDLRNECFEVPVPSLTTTMVCGGTSRNVVPNSCTFSVDRRLLPGESADEAVRQIERVADEVLKGSGVSFQLSVVSEWDPYFIEPGHPVVGLVRRVAEEVTGRPVELKCKSSATDASHIYAK